MNRRRMLLSLLGGVVLVLGLVAANAADAAVVQNERVPVSGTVTNCDGELVAFAGVCHFVTHETVDKKGGLHFDFHVNCHVQLENLVTGEKGVGNEEFHTNFNTKAGTPYEQTDTLSFSQIFPGPGDNFIVKVVFHVTVNAKGRVTAEVLRVEEECR